MFFQRLLHRFWDRKVSLYKLRECPNCWGYSQWDQDQPLFFNLDKGQCSEINSRNGFIRRFVKKYVGLSRR